MKSLSPGNARPVATLLVLVAYCLTRSDIYHRFPIDSVASWFARDTWMTIPRFVAFVMIFCIWTGWKTLPADWAPTGPLQAKVIGVIAIAIWCFYYSASRGPFFAPLTIAIAAATSFVVALFEEYAFRGPLLIELTRRSSASFAIVITSALFTIYHVQAQPLEFWAAIFLTGMMFAGLRSLGMGLGCLVLIHTVVDSVYFYFGSHPPPLAGFHGIVLLVGLLICAISAFPPSKQRIAKFSR